MDRLKNVPGWAGFAITLCACNFGLCKPQTHHMFFLILWMLVPLAGLGPVTKQVVQFVGSRRE